MAAKRDAPELPAPDIRKVLVNGVTVDMYDDTKPSRMAPMTASLRFLAESPNVDVGGDKSVILGRLRDAGVRSIPLYQSKAVEAGIEWEEV